MIDYPIYVSYWLVNAFLVYSFSVLFPQGVELGTQDLNVLQSMVYSGFWINFLFWAFWDFFKQRNLRIESPLWGIAFIWGINTVSIWMVARFAHVTGFGIANYFWAIGIGAVATFFQLIVWSGDTKK